jgi:hypothetical protein
MGGSEPRAGILESATKGTKGQKAQKDRSHIRYEGMKVRGYEGTRV